MAIAQCFLDLEQRVTNLYIRLISRHNTKRGGPTIFWTPSLYHNSFDEPKSRRVHHAKPSRRSFDISYITLMRSCHSRITSRNDTLYTMMDRSAKKSPTIRHGYIIEPISSANHTTSATTKRSAAAGATKATIMRAAKYERFSRIVAITIFVRNRK